MKIPGSVRFLARLQIQAIYRESGFSFNLRVERTDGKGPPSKIQSICNRKCDANYNAKPCAGEGKAAGAGTMANNGKSNAQSNGNSRKIRASADVRLDAGRQGDGAARESPPSGMRRFGILVMT